MAFTTPSLLDIWTRMRNAMRTFLPGTDAWIEPNNLSVAGRSFSLTMGSAYERLLYLYRQLFASTADAWHLEYRHAFDYGVTRKPPAPARGIITFTLTGGEFVTIPAGYTVARPDGVLFAFLQTAIPDSMGVCSVLVQATQTGAHTNTLPATPLNFVANPSFPMLPATAVVTRQGLGGGADPESDEALRKRVLLRKRQPPHGGAQSDYEQWALAVPGVTRVFVSPFKVADPVAQVASPLTLYPLFDDTRVHGIPTAEDLEVVAAALDQDRPVTARLYVAAAVPVPISIEIRGLQQDSPGLRASAMANLAVLFAERVPVVTMGNGFTLPVAWIDEAIGRSEGYIRHTLRQPAGDLAFSPGQLPVLGLISFGA